MTGPVCVLSCCIEAGGGPMSWSKEFLAWVRRWESNPRPSSYELDELPSALLRVVLRASHITLASASSGCKPSTDLCTSPTKIQICMPQIYLSVAKKYRKLLTCQSRLSQSLLFNFVIARCSAWFAQEEQGICPCIFRHFSVLRFTVSITSQLDSSADLQ